MVVVVCPTCARLRVTFQIAQGIIHISEVLHFSGVYILQGSLPVGALRVALQAQ